jgi:hypothetical protein
LERKKKMWSDLESLVATGDGVTEVAAGRAALLLFFSRSDLHAIVRPEHAVHGARPWDPGEQRRGEPIVSWDISGDHGCEGSGYHG